MSAPHAEPFVPLLTVAPSNEERAEFRVTVIGKGAGAQSFQSLSAQHSSKNARAGCEPKVSLEREGDRITGIRILCNCGQVIELACEYGE